MLRRAADERPQPEVRSVTRTGGRRRSTLLALVGLVVLQGSACSPRHAAPIADATMPPKPSQSVTDDDSFRLASTPLPPDAGAAAGVVRDDQRPNGGPPIYIALSGTADNLSLSFRYGSDEPDAPALMVFSVVVKGREGNRSLFHCDANAARSASQTLPNPWRYGYLPPSDSGVKLCDRLTPGEYEVFVDATRGHGHLAFHVAADRTVTAATPTSDGSIADRRTLAQEQAARQQHNRRWDEIAAVPNDARAVRVGGTVLQLEGCHLIVTDFDGTRHVVDLTMRAPCNFAVGGGGKTQVVETAEGPNLLVLSVHDRRPPGSCDTEMRAVAVREVVRPARRKTRSHTCTAGPIDVARFRL